MLGATVGWTAWVVLSLALKGEAAWLTASGFAASLFAAEFIWRGRRK